MPAHTDEYRQMDLDELDTRVSQAKQELFNLRFQVVTGRLDNTARLGQVRRDVARMLTILREREINAAEALESGRPADEVEAAAPSARAVRRAARVRAAREAEAAAETRAAEIQDVESEVSEPEVSEPEISEPEITDTAAPTAAEPDEAEEEATDV